MSVVQPALAARAPQVPPSLVLSMIGVPALGAAAAVALAVHNGGVRPATMWLFAIFYLASAIGVELGFHRYFSHRSFKCGRAMRFFLGACGSIAGQGPVLYWAAIHRVHHRFADSEQDPHTPHPLGLARLFRSHIGWLFAAPPPDMAKALPDLMHDRTTLVVQRYYLAIFAIGLAVPTLIGWVLGGPEGGLEGFLWGGLARIFASQQVTWSVNSICHLVGARPHATRDNSRNVWLLAFPTLGGSWHNNHHAMPASATNDFKWWQLDPGAWLIRLAAFAGLVWDVKEPKLRISTP